MTSNFILKTDYAGVPQLCRVIQGTGDATSGLEVIARGAEVDEIMNICITEFFNGVTTNQEQI